MAPPEPKKRTVAQGLVVTGLAPGAIKTGNQLHNRLIHNGLQTMENPCVNVCVNDSDFDPPLGDDDVAALGHGLKNTLSVEQRMALAKILLG